MRPDANRVWETEITAYVTKYVLKGSWFILTS